MTTEYMMLILCMNVSYLYKLILSVNRVSSAHATAAETQTL